LVSFKSNTLEVVYIVLIRGYNGKEKVIIALKTESNIHFKTIFFAKATSILKPKEYYVIYLYKHLWKRTQSDRKK